MYSIQRAGFKATLQTLDMATAHLPTDGPVVVVTASYEGEPADNARQFVGWLENLSPSAESVLLKDVAYAVFGCGNREWARTYQRIPTLIDATLQTHGARRLVERGEADASDAAFFESFDRWLEGLWGALEKVSSRLTYMLVCFLIVTFDFVEQEYGVKNAGQVSTSDSTPLKVELVDAGTTRAKLLRQPDAAMGKVIENRVLTKAGTPEKRHIGTCVLPLSLSPAF